MILLHFRKIMYADHHCILQSSNYFILDQIKKCPIIGHPDTCS